MSLHQLSETLTEENDTENNEAASEEIEAWCQKYVGQFLESEEAKKLTPYEKEECPSIIHSFSQLFYLNDKEMPGEWTASNLRDICVHFVPENVPGSDEFFQAIVPILTTFLEWVTHQKIWRNTQSLKEVLQTSKKEMLKNASTKENWSNFKCFLMAAKELGVDLANEEELEAFLMEYIEVVKEAETGIYDKDERLNPKQADEIKTIADAAEDLEYLTRGFPTAAVVKALMNPKEITPVLFDFLEHALENCDCLEEGYMGHIYALFFLAQFREKRAFSYAIKFASFSEENVENLLGDVITENLHQIMGSFYDGNLDALKKLIESPDIYIWSRGAGLRTLLVLIKAKVLERDFVIGYFKDLFHHPSIENDNLLMAQLIHAAYDLYPLELINEIKAAYEKGQVDLEFIEWNEVERVLAQDKEKALKKNLYDNREYNLIENVPDILFDWTCFQTEEDEDQEDFEIDEFLYHSDMSYKREESKLGRNELCLCGSGKKFKKCCLEK
ncbi:MAG: DUF1186 domain-containing protein [Alphaproteobacteria bacterium]|nr:DUF1186 domain-containing protein [Alphaproteobacteria bacterium]